MRFNRSELAGSLGDLGTLLPIGLGLILICGLDATAVFLLVGLFYVLSGLYFRVTVPVQPMKVISAYAIASAMSADQVVAAGFCLGVLLILLAATNAIALIGKLVSRAVVRGVQLTVGVLLATQGIRFMLGSTPLQAIHGQAEPFLAVQAIGPLPIGLVLGVAAVVVILVLLPNRVAPAALVVIGLGAAAGLALGAYRHLGSVDPGLHLPALTALGSISPSDWVVGLTVLALPQLPMTIGNAILAQADLSQEYFGPEDGRRCTPRAFTLSMGLANLAAAFLGGMPLCHGAGGLAAHYRFGARSAGSNLMIGAFFLVLALGFGSGAAALLGVLPFSVLGALLCFAGLQLAMTILDVQTRPELAVSLSILIVATVSDLAIGFGVGILLSLLFRFTRVEV